MRMIANLHHSDERSGTTIIDNNGTELRVHWTEGYSDAIICEGLRGSVIGVIRADGETSNDTWKTIKPILEDPGQNARMMTEEEEADHDAAMAMEI